MTSATRDHVVAAGQGLIGLRYQYTTDSREDLKHRFDWYNKLGCSLGDCPFHARDKQIPPASDWFVWLMRTGRKWGKMLAVDTPIPTPDGWNSLGDLEVGDIIFDEAGQPCNVEAVYDGWPDTSYRLKFSDGAHLDACGDHLWVTSDHKARKAEGRRVGDGRGMWGLLPKAGPKLRTTTEIVSSLFYGKRSDPNHSIPLCAPLRTPEIDLPIAPYILGLWLGDGDSAAAAITTVDEEVVASIRDAGHLVMPYKQAEDKAPTYGISNLHTELREIGVLGNKRVPARYLRAAPAQRLALLQGLMDSDGYAERSRAEFSTTNEALRDGVVELARSLGQKPRVYSGRAMLNGKDCGPKWRVVWRPTMDVFRLARKAKRIPANAGRKSRGNTQRMIVGAERIPLQPMRCITVSSPSGLFLAGEAMIPTHNTRSAAEYIIDQVQFGGKRWVGLVSDTAADVRDIMIEGESGILTISPPWFRPLYEPSKRRLTWPNDARASCYSAEDPEQLRGPGHDLVWCDELAKWKKQQEAWDMMIFGLTLGDDPHCVVTTTPRPTKLVKELSKREDVVLVRGHTDENLENLAPTVIETIIKPYEGTRQGKQELAGDILEDVVGALWVQSEIEELRVESAPELSRVVVAIDPSGSDDEGASEQGIITAGIGMCSCSGTPTLHGFVIADDSGHYTPEGWALTAIGAYDKHGCDRIVAEVNYGGAMVKSTLKNVDPDIPYRSLTATRGKRVRAEPISALYEQRKIHHVGVHDLLESQLTGWTPDQKSPDRLDACLVAGTLVETEAGVRPIESIRAGANVWTRQGLRTVLWAGQTRNEADVITVHLSNGETLTGTADHPVFVEERGFVPLHTLVWSDILYSWEKVHTAAIFTVGDGVRSTGRSLMAVSSTTKTEIPETISSRTLSVLHRRSTPRAMRRSTLKPAERTWRRFDLWPLPGIDHRRAGRGIANMDGLRGEGESGYAGRAWSAVSLTRRSLLSGPSSFAHGSVFRDITNPSDAITKPDHVLSVARRSLSRSRRSSKSALVSVVGLSAAGTAPVYNLTVADQPEFFANGVLVHNCVWAFTDLFKGKKKLQAW